MYTIAPKTLKEYIEDTSVKLPRFQRKATWNEKKRFELALSIFKNYPLGASILSREKQIKYLLDGRQRRDTLTMIYENPEVLYFWGKKYFHVKKSDDVQELKRKFDEGVQEFIELDTDDEKEAQTSEEDESFDENVNENAPSEQLDEDSVEDDELSALKSAICFGFLNKSGKMSGLTAAFDFRQYFEEKPIFWNGFYEEDHKTISGKKLRDKIHEYCRRYPSTYRQKEEFIKFMSDYGFKSETLRVKFEKEIEADWSDRQLKVIEFFEVVDRIFQSRSISFIETFDITPTDSQKIFNLINTGGTKLTSSEILSAKPKWNSVLPPVSQNFRAAIKSLYGELTLDVADSENPVKWDIPASLTYYLGDDQNSGLGLFFNLKDIAKRITTGFQLFTGFHYKGVKKEDIAEMADKFDWDHYEDKCQIIKHFFNALSTNKYLKILRSWGKCLSDVVSDGPTLNFLFLAFRSFVELGGPVGFESTKKRIFDKNVFILLDQAIYQYQCNLWKGSSDSLIAKNIEAFENHKDRDENGLFTPIEKTRWEDTLKQVFDDNQINGRPIVKDSLLPMVYYYCILIEKKGKDYEDPGEVDHILPQAAWTSASISNKEAVQNSLFNLALLPKSINGPKSNNCLSSIEINAPHLASEISDYEEIPEGDFKKYSNVSNYEDLKTLRRGLYEKAYIDTRKTILAS